MCDGNVAETVFIFRWKTEDNKIQAEKTQEPIRKRMHGADTKYKQARENCVAIHLKLLQFFLAWLLIGWKRGRGFFSVSQGSATLLPNQSDWTRCLSNSHQSWPITVRHAGQLNSPQIWPMDRPMTAGQMNSHKSNQSPYGKQINERC